MRSTGTSWLILLSGFAAIESAHAQHISTRTAAAVISPLVVIVLAIVLAILNRNWLTGIVHVGLVGLWVALLIIASQLVENDYIIWTPLALYVLHAIIILILLLSAIIKRVSVSS